MELRSLELVAAGAVALAGMVDGLLDPPEWQEPAPVARERNEIPGVPLKTHEGRSVHFHDDLLRDRRVVISTMEAGCKNTCLPVTHTLVQVQQQVDGRAGLDVFMYSPAFEPEQVGPQDAFRRWCMVPALAEPRQIGGAIEHVDRKPTRRVCMFPLGTR
jgi:hypothetical protein